MKTTPGDFTFHPQTDSLANEQQVHLGIYEALYFGQEGNPKVPSREIGESQDCDIVADGLNDTQACPQVARSVQAERLEPK